MANNSLRVVTSPTGTIDPLLSGDTVKENVYSNGTWADSWFPGLQQGIKDFGDKLVNEDPLVSGLIGLTQDKLDQQQDTKLVSDATDDYISQVAKEMGIKLTDENRDYLTQYVLNEKASENAWNRSVFAEQNKTQWAMQDLQKAGLNPFLAISGMNAGSSASSSPGSVSGGLYTESKNTVAKNNQEKLDNLTKIITAIVSAVGLAIAFGK